MNERVESVVRSLVETAADAKQKFGGLSADQVNWRPAENSWSVGQCLDHLIRTNTEFYPEFERLASGTRQNTFWQNYSPFTGFFGRFLIKAVSEDSKKAKAPSKRIVPPSDLPADIVERFVKSIEGVNTRINAVAGADLHKTVVSSPFLRLMTYKLDDAYTVLVEHTKRHIRQADRVMQADGFPR